MIDDIILNSFMDLCVKFKIPDDAIHIYEMTKSDEPQFKNTDELDSDNDPASMAEKACSTKNKSIQVGILIKAYG